MINRDGAEVLGRKTLRDGGKAFGALLKDMRDTLAEIAGRQELAAIHGRLLDEAV